MLSSLSGRETVSNVPVYVCDSLRFDALPERIENASVWGRAIVASTFTGSGYPAILTGRYPSNHRVWKLTEVLPRRPPLLDLSADTGIDDTTMWGSVDDPTDKPPIRMCHERENTTLDGVDSPFVLVVHDVGGHMLYGKRERNDWESNEAFFSDLRGQPDQIEDLYREGVADSIDRFLGLCEDLRDPGEYDDTLVVFTSDHGEPLGSMAASTTTTLPSSRSWCRCRWPS